MGGRFAFTIEALEPHLPLPRGLEAVQQQKQQGAGESAGGREDGKEDAGYTGRGWELMPSGRVAHLRAYVEEVALKSGFEIDAVCLRVITVHVCVSRAVRDV
jgi:predicted TPR repeat methyltransferase